MEFEITSEIKEQDRKQIYEGLLEYNLARLEDKNPKDLGIYHKEDGVIKAGLIAETHGKWLKIQYLWVSEVLRGKNIGSSLLNKAESVAQERGCQFAFVDTFDFQAPLFYLKHGYTEQFTLEEYPCTGKRHYFTKELKESEHMQEEK